MTKELRVKLIKLWLLMRLHECRLKEGLRVQKLYVSRLEDSECDTKEYSKALDSYYELDNSCSCLSESIDYLSSALGVDKITVDDFDEEFISIDDVMPDEKQEVIALFEFGQICVTSWRYSKIRKRPYFAYEDDYGDVKSWIPLEESDV